MATASVPTTEQRRARRLSARPVLVWLHRYVGLAIAVFVAIAGLTGSVLAYIGPLREALVPERFHATAHGAPLPLEALDARVLAALPDGRNARIAEWPLDLAAGRVAAFEVAGRLDPTTGLERAIAVDTVHLDPVSGAVLGTTRGTDGQPAAATVLDFLYSLHHSLALPGAWGVWIMGIAALLWFFDCFVGAWLTLPRGRPFLVKWKPAWQVQPRRFTFDLHRAAGLWFFGMLAVLALSSVQMNLNDEVFMPVASRLMRLTPDPVEADAATHASRGRCDAISPQEAFDRARHEASARRWSDAPERMQLDETRHVFRVVFTTPESEWLTATRREVYLDACDGHVVYVFAPGRGTAGDTAVDWLGALHVGSVLGWPYKLLLCITGLVIGALSVTGIVVWWRKRRGRLAAARARTAQRGEPSVQIGRPRAAPSLARRSAPRRSRAARSPST